MSDIRRGKIADAAALTDIALAAKSHWGYPQSWIEVWREDLTVTPQYVAENPVYVAQCGNIIAGFVALNVDGHEAALDHLWVLPEYMGQGLGRALLLGALKYCAAVGVQRLSVAADPNAVKFYSKLGAVHRGRIDSKPARRTLPVLDFDLAAFSLEE